MARQLIIRAYVAMDETPEPIASGVEQIVVATILRSAVYCKLSFVFVTMLDPYSVTVPELLFGGR